VTSCEDDLIFYDLLIFFLVGFGCTEPEGRSRREGAPAEGPDCRWNCTAGDCLQLATRTEDHKEEEEEEEGREQQEESEDYYMEMGEEQDLSGKWKYH
jgi:hypothetical protein